MKSYELIWNYAIQSYNIEHAHALLSNIKTEISTSKIKFFNCDWIVWNKKKENTRNVPKILALQS